jgi:Fe-S-cluster containining protein
VSGNRTPFFEETSLHFECTSCGDCCIAPDGYHVYLDRNEAEAIRGFLGLSSGWFRRRYLNRLADGDLVAAAEADGRCVFLQADGHCRVYPVRPLQCRTYPFWPEVLASRHTWQREARRCEGINRGREVPYGRIRRNLKACLRYDR